MDRRIGEYISLELFYPGNLSSDLREIEAMSSCVESTKVARQRARENAQLEDREIHDAAQEYDE